MGCGALRVRGLRVGDAQGGQCQWACVTRARGSERGTAWRSAKHCAIWVPVCSLNVDSNDVVTTTTRARARARARGDTRHRRQTSGSLAE
eukprot:5557324-Prymnesium_polylepis.1